jgi:chondroitin AC lyase
MSILKRISLLKDTRNNMHRNKINKRSFILPLGSIILSLLLPFYLPAQQLDSGAIALMKSRIIELESTGYPQPGSVQKILQSMNSNGSWNGIDYKSIGVSPWPPFYHLGGYVLPLAKAYANPKSIYYHNSELAKGIRKSLDFWLIHNFTTQNWWEGDIGVPMTLTSILILMGKEITYDEFLRALNQMRGSYISQTGQNKIWRAGIQLKIGLIAYGRGVNNLIGAPQIQGQDRKRARKSSNVLLMYPPRLIRLASDTLKENLLVQEDEGIQSDWSFHQHGVQLQFGNYGLDYAFSHAEWSYILNGTPFQYPTEKISILRHFILYGLGRVVWKDNMDISALGRHIVIPAFQASGGERLIQLLQLMVKVDPDNALKYRQVIRLNKGEASKSSFLEGNTYFWRSAMMVNRSANNYVSVRMCSKVIQSTESGIGENLFGAHLSDGATFIYHDGKEYKDIFPVWDWHRIPGVTSYSNKKLPVVGWDGLHNGSDFVGGVSDSLYGTAGMLFDRNGLQAYKGWFFGPSGLICLGAGITSDQDYSVLTTLNQNLLKGPIIVKKGTAMKTLSVGQLEEGNNIKWVYQNGEGYLFLQNEHVFVGATEQKGSWSRIHVTSSSKEVQKKIFNLWVDHGSKPREASYAYMILPIESEKELNNFAINPPVRILKNTSRTQAIQFTNSKLTQMIFYQADTLKFENFTVSVNAACLLMFQQVHGLLKVTISVPPELPHNVDLFINGHYKGKDCIYNNQEDHTKVTFTLPGSTFAGQSESRILQIE